jgi:hypothetical protein
LIEEAGVIVTQTWTETPPSDLRPGNLADFFSRAFKRHYRVRPRAYRKPKALGSVRDTRQLTEMTVI